MRPDGRRSAREGRPRGRLRPGAGRDGGRRAARGRQGRVDHPDPRRIRRGGPGDLEAALRKALADAHARPDGGPVLVGGNCLGIVSKRQYNTFFLPQYKLPFHDARGDSLVAVSQSGAYLVSLTSNLDGIVFPRASISYGNQMDLTAADFLEFFADDPTVRLLVFYIEGFAPGDGERFVKVARRVTAEGRHVIVFKAGKTALGRRGDTQSHGLARRRLRGREGAPRGRRRPGRPDARHVRGLHEGPHDARRPAARQDAASRCSRTRASSARRSSTSSMA